MRNSALSLVPSAVMIQRYKQYMTKEKQYIGNYVHCVDSYFGGPQSLKKRKHPTQYEAKRYTSHPNTSTIFYVRIFAYKERKLRLEI